MQVKLIKLLVIFTAGLSLTAHAQSGGNATLPLEELLDLHEASTQKQQTPPTPASLQSVVLKSRLLRGALKLTAQVHLSVLSNNWVDVPLFALNPGLTIEQVSDIKNGHIIIQGGLVTFVSNTPGEYFFSVELTQKANFRSGLFRAELKSFPATVLRMELQHDNTSFAVNHDISQINGDSLTLLPKGGVFQVTWKEKKLNETPIKIKARPKIQPVIKEAIADIVSTLDGQRIARYHYNLALQGSQTLTLTIPPGQVVTKVFLNGVSIPFTSENHCVVATVAPPQVGGEKATLELVTQTGALPYSLSGHLTFSLPSVSWDLNEQYVTLHLPDVFNYTRKGGSLGLSETHRSVSFVHNIPTPGKTVLARQQLVTQSPDLKLKYTVDLEGKYFRGTGYEGN